MFCTQCGTKMQKSQRFCTGCGTQVKANAGGVAGESKTIDLHKSPDVNRYGKDQAQAVRTAVVADSVSPSSTVHAPKTNTGKPMWWMPVSAALLVLLGIGGYYAYEVKVTGDVEQERQYGETLALQGKYAEAMTQFQAGLAQRPNHLVLQADLGFLKTAQAVQDLVKNAQDLMKQQQYDKSLAALDQADAKAKQNQGSLYDLLQKQVAEQKTTVAVAQVKSQMKDKKSIEDLAPLLDKLSAYDVPEAKDADKQIRSQIADIAYSQANQLMQNKQYSDALAEVNKGLTYDSGNSKLLSFKDTINKQQADFEQAEQQRIEQAMVSQAKENEKNKTQAVQVLNISGTATDFGDYQIQGQIKNVATRPVSMVMIQYAVYDANNNLLYNGSTDVYPNYLEPGDTGSFNDTAFGVYNGKRVEVTKTTWYVE